MADKNLPAITEATSIAAADLLYAVIGGNSRRIKLSNVLTSAVLVTPNIGVAVGTSLVLSGILDTTGPIRGSHGYTVATLPVAGTAGRMAYVTDALAPSFLTTVVGGGAVIAPVFDNGTNWVGA